MEKISEESIQLLKEKCNLIDVLSPYVQMKKNGIYYKGCCPFHQEKTPSFFIKKGDQHYHCFGCGAHGDVISFYTQYLKMSFQEACVSLSEQFKVPLNFSLEKNQGKEKRKGKELLQKLTRLFHTLLMHTDEGRKILPYLYKRGIDNEAITTFQIGWMPSTSTFKKICEALKISKQDLAFVGMLNSQGKLLFYERIAFPLANRMGEVVGFSSRTTVEDYKGPKYVNTPQTALFEKSRFLYGLPFAIHTIVSEKRAILVEGQIDTFRMLQEGFASTVSAGGTAFGTDHVKLLCDLGVHHVYIAFDRDSSGDQAALKVGQEFQKRGVEVSVVRLPHGCDPDTVLRERGPLGMQEYIEKAPNFIVFAFNTLKEKTDISTPAGKNQVVQALIKYIEQWDHPLMVHEAYKKIAQEIDVPESLLPRAKKPSQSAISTSAGMKNSVIAHDRFVEMDLLRLLLLTEDKALITYAEENVSEADFLDELCRNLYKGIVCSAKNGKEFQLLHFVKELEEAEQQLLLREILQKRVNKKEAKKLIQTVCETLLQRTWMRKREDIKMQIYSGQHTESEIFELAKEFDALLKIPPKSGAFDEA